MPLCPCCGRRVFEVATARLAATGTQCAHAGCLAASAASGGGAPLPGVRRVPNLAAGIGVERGAGLRADSPAGARGRSRARDGFGIRNAWSAEDPRNPVARGPPPPDSSPAHPSRGGPRNRGGAARHLGQHRLSRHHGRVRQRRRRHPVGHHLQRPHLRGAHAGARSPRGHRRSQAGVRDRARVECGRPRAVRARTDVRMAACRARPPGGGNRVSPELRPRPRDPLVLRTRTQPGPRLVHHRVRRRPHAGARRRGRARGPLRMAGGVLVQGASRARRGRSGRLPGAGPGSREAGRAVRPARRARSRRDPRRRSACPQPGAPLRMGRAPLPRRSRPHRGLVRAPRAAHPAPRHRRAPVPDPNRSRPPTSPTC